MARKIYKTIRNITCFSIGLVIPATKDSKVEQRQIHFNGGITHPRFIPSTHIEEVEKWQKALEASPFYGVKYTLAASLPDTPKKETPVAPILKAKDPPEQPETPIKKIHQVKTLQGAVENLIKNGYTGDTDELTDRVSIVAAAKSINIEYTKLAE